MILTFCIYPLIKKLLKHFQVKNLYFSEVFWDGCRLSTSCFDVFPCFLWIPQYYISPHIADSTSQNVSPTYYGWYIMFMNTNWAPACPTYSYEYSPRSILYPSNEKREGVTLKYRKSQRPPPGSMRKYFWHCLSKIFLLTNCFSYQFAS